MKSFLKKIKTKKKEKKSFDIIKELEIELVRTKYANNPKRLQSELKKLNKVHVIDKNLDEIRNEILRDYIGEFEMIGRLKIAHQTRETHIRFRNIDDFEAYINATDQDYESDDGIFNGYVFKLNAPQFNLVSRSRCGNGCDFKHGIIEFRGNNCFIPTKG